MFSDGALVLTDQDGKGDGMRKPQRVRIPHDVREQESVGRYLEVQVRDRDRVGRP